jgi:hypothetical protein
MGELWKRNPFFRGNCGNVILVVRGRSIAGRQEQGNGEGNKTARLGKKTKWLLARSEHADIPYCITVPWLVHYRS